MIEFEEMKPESIVDNRYTIIEPIGEGGFARVVKCRDNTLDELVAVKILKPEFSKSKDIIKRFKREIKISRKITHKNICRIYNFGTHDNLFFIVMELMEGMQLSEYLSSRDSLDDDIRYSIAIKILQGLETAHEQNIVHRDLKPQNIMIINNFEPILMDFGLAKYYGEKIDKTSKLNISGTPEYMSPEQIKLKGLDNRSDIYAFGIILYEMFTGKYPYSGTKAIDLIYNHISEVPPAPIEIDPEIHSNLNEIIQKCMRKNPEERYQNVSDILSELLSVYSDLQREKGHLRKTVLIADDEQSVRHMLSQMFDMLNMDVIATENGREAVKKSIKEQPDLICLDIMMPEMNGLDAAKLLLSTEQTKEIPIVILSCKDDNETMIYSRELGIRDYLVKPFRFEDLKIRLDFWLHSPF